MLAQLAFNIVLSLIKSIIMSIIIIILGISHGPHRYKYETIAIQMLN